MLYCLSLHYTWCTSKWFILYAQVKHVCRYVCTERKPLLYSKHFAINSSSKILSIPRVIQHRKNPYTGNENLHFSSQKLKLKVMPFPAAPGKARRATTLKAGFADFRSHNIPWPCHLRVLRLSRIMIRCYRYTYYIAWLALGLFAPRRAAQYVMGAIAAPSYT